MTKKHLKSKVEFQVNIEKNLKGTRGPKFTCEGIAKPRSFYTTDEEWTKFEYILSKIDASKRRVFELIVDQLETLEFDPEVLLEEYKPPYNQNTKIHSVTVSDEVWAKFTKASDTIKYKSSKRIMLLFLLDNFKI